MGYYNTQLLPLYQYLHQSGHPSYAIADNFFQGAFGGSFLNHQYLICACAPEYPNADTSPAKNSISAIDVDAEGHFVRLTPSPTAPSSALDGPPTYLRDSTLTPADEQGKFHAVNTMQPPYQPSGNAPAASDATKLYADPAKATTLPPQTATTIGDLLDARGIGWAWYAGSWKAVSANRSGIYNGSVPNFQAHHHPFNYYASFDPLTHADARAAHLKDYGDLLGDAAAGTLPPVAFYKPQGNVNQHPGYTDVADGDAHIAEVIAALQAGPQWQHMLIVVAYDENGGFYDHAKVPHGDRWGPGTRIPAIIVSPFAKKGFVDSTQYDTASVLRFITHRFNLPMLPGLAQRDAQLRAHGYPAMGDLSGALDFAQ